MDCLNTSQECSAARQKAAHYLLLHKSRQWSWNYWERDSSSRAYPDDLDDSACAIASILGVNPELVDADAQATIAKNLIQCETKPGGPYVTWLVRSADTRWQDVDPAVNANIGYMLSRLGVQTPAMQEYIETCLKNRTLQSPYYVGGVPTLYFIARWYKGSALPLLRSYITIELSKSGLSTLQRAMLITAGLNAGCRSELLQRHVEHLVQEQHDDHWASAPLYYEPPEGGKQRYAGSAELTTAFAVEALQTIGHRQASVVSLTSQAPTSLKSVYKQLLIRQTSSEVIDIAGVIARTGGWRLNEAALRHLNRGSRNGWLAYSIYDDVLDGDGEVLHLSIANMALRRSLLHFAKAIPDARFNSFVAKVFDEVDAANVWELTHARDANQLPRYGAYKMLAQRSWGHVIAPTGVMVLAGYALDSPEVAQLHAFFRQYIIAKQLCDDAHDWLPDLRAEHITPIVALLLRELPQADEVSHQLHFWRHTIDEVNSLIREHLARAEQTLRECRFIVHKDEMLQWLTALERSCARAEQAREETRQFITAFSARSLVD